MKFQELSILLPCHSLEDFPQHHEDEEADGLLANWTALWHPALIASAEAAPTWHRVDHPPERLEDRLIVVPSVSVDRLAAEFPQRAKDEGACLIRRQQDRREILERAWAVFDGPGRDIDAELAGDFLALGYCYLQIQLLTRQMRYSSNLDNSRFNRQLVEGAKAAINGDMDLSREKLTACFDMLAEERDHYYSVDAFLIDITLVAEQTLGPSLWSELRGRTPVNLLMSAELLGPMQEQAPDTLAALREALGAGQAGLVGGEEVERRLPLLSCESLLAELWRGQQRWQSQMGQEVRVFGRRRSGLTPFLPQVLEKLGFTGALHATLDDGRFPLGSQIKTRWEGVAGVALDALARAPLDARKPSTFLGLATKLGESMDADHVATLLFAHWPGQACAWYDDLRRCTKFGSTLGKFVTAEAYFRDTYMPVHLDRFEADQYRSPYLRQAMARNEVDPLTTLERYWRRQVTAAASQALNTLAALITGRPPAESFEVLQRAIDASSEQPETADLDRILSERMSSSQAAFAAALPRAEAPAAGGYLVTNPFSHVRRVALDVSALSVLPTVERPIYAADASDGRKQVVVDVPPMGYAWIAAGQRRAAHKRQPTPVLAEDLRDEAGVILLRNEFLEAALNPTTGALQSVKDYASRGNRLSQQLALRAPAPRGRPGDRWRDPDELAAYSVMKAEAVEIATATTVLGEIVVRGRLLDREGNSQAAFRETFRLGRGTRVLRLEIELHPEHEPTGDPWNTYYACRFAWSDETADLFRGINQVRQPATRKRLEAPLYVEIDNGEERTAILSGGLPYHRRVGERMLDSLLYIPGERQRTFTLGIGVDVANAHHEALGLLAPEMCHFQTAPPPRTPSSWLFHIDARNVATTHWEPLFEGERNVGVRVRLLETAGRACRAKLSAFRSVRLARHVDFRGQPGNECRLHEGRVHLELAAGEWLQIDVFWA